jgi:hypothetical protein
MKTIDFPIEKLNEFLKDHSFVIQNPFGDGLNEEMNVTVKVKLTGVKPMISIGEWKDYIEYTLFLEDIDSEFGRGVFGHQFDILKTNDYKILNTDTKFYLTTVKVNHLLSNFLKYWGVDNYVTCTRIVNHIEKIIPKYMTESVVIEDKYDYIIDKLVDDVLNTFNEYKEGEFGLPEDISDDMVYEFPEINELFTISLEMIVNQESRGIDVNGEYYEDDNTIELKIESGPNPSSEDLKELYYELNELIAHELVHVIQHDSEYEFPKKEPKLPYKYYTQKHELEAQIVGFKRRAKKEEIPLESVIRDWFKKNQLKHRLRPNDIERVINRILELS